MKVWFLLLILEGQVWAVGPYTKEECQLRLWDERGHEDKVRPVQSVCIHKNNSLIQRGRWCLRDDSPCIFGSQWRTKWGR